MSTATFLPEGFPLWLFVALAATAAYVIHLAMEKLFPSALAQHQAAQAAAAAKQAAEPEERDPPRDFTLAQLRKFNGEEDPNGSPFDGTKGKIYISLKGEVYDTSSAASMYGVGGPYHIFAGHDCSYAMATMSLNDEDLDKLDLSGLSSVELGTLDEWIQKFKHVREYPVVGRLCEPPPRKPMKLASIAEFNGGSKTPEGRVNPPVLIAVTGKVFDVSFGGFDMYKPGATYNLFAGKDASKALAKMSFQDEDLNSRDLSDLTETQQKTLADWVAKFENSRLYPIVGDLSD